MNLLSRYLAREIYGSTALVFAALTMLFSFFDLINELGSLGHGNYRIGYVLLYVLLSVPGHIYEIFPAAVLIGTIVALVQMAAHSELTIYRASGASLTQMIVALFRAGVPLMILSLLFGEFFGPPSDRLAQELRLKATNSTVSVGSSGVWVKDEHSFVNARSMLPDTSLLGVKIYQFDDSYHLVSVTSAKHAIFENNGLWKLEGVAQTSFAGRGTTAENTDSMDWQSSITPDLLNVLLVAPDRMSAWNLYQYTRYLHDNKQKTARYEIAMWNKVLFPIAVFVMMLLALPFATYNRRAGGVSAKIFAGVVLGLSYYFIGRLFGNLGALNDWQPVLSATAMTWLFLLLAVGMLWLAERR